MKRIILLGAPGAGKGTLAAKVCAAYNIPHISTGDIFRKNIKEGTPLGQKVKNYTDKGLLVPDEVTIEIVRLRLSEIDCASGWLLDGFPRTIPQAEALDKITAIDCVIDIDVPESLLLYRLTGRRTCPDCGEIYHISTHSGAGCAKCGAKLIIRADDSETTVSQRIETYNAQTLPLIGYYKAKGLLVSIKGGDTPDEVFKEAVRILG